MDNKEDLTKDIAVSFEDLKESMRKGKAFFIKHKKWVKVYYVIGNLSWILCLFLKEYLLFFILWVVFFPDHDQITGFIVRKLRKSGWNG